MGPKTLLYIESHLKRSFITRLNSEKFQKLSFLREYFYEFIIYIKFAIFLKMPIPIMRIFVKIFENHMQGEFVKIREFTSYYFCDFPSKKAWKIWSFSEFSPTKLGCVFPMVIWPAFHMAHVTWGSIESTTILTMHPSLLMLS